MVTDGTMTDSSSDKAKIDYRKRYRTKETSCNMLNTTI